MVADGPSPAQWRRHHRSGHAVGLVRQEGDPQEVSDEAGRYSREEVSSDQGQGRLVRGIR